WHLAITESNRTARMDESARPPGTNTNVNMTLSLEDLQRLMETTINTAMDRRFGPEIPAVRNPGLPRDPGPPGPPIPPLPPVLGGGTGLVAPYQPGNTTTIRARDIGYFDPDLTCYGREMQATGRRVIYKSNHTESLRSGEFVDLLAQWFKP
ncbi:MAG: hypothetical protein M1816_000898, partial [Peltula sp. TS41687]